ncbi:pca operon transcription factor PcaQ [Amorphus sp. 3PC139-8]|uniref:pca operon transcription factor PcaQ n=1 Tax=Amorphus sp. 3PC139-8 TaxID=2735676 RepID=UPI00345CD4E5
MFQTKIKLRHLQCFIEIARERNVTQAAQKLSTVQPALSRTLKELEDELGTRLFQRTRDGLVLTEAGETLYRYAFNGMQQVKEGLERAAGEGPGEIVSLGVLPNVSRRVLPTAIADFKKAHPDTRIRVVTGTNADLLIKLRAGRLDFVLGRMADPETMKGLSFELLFHESIVFASRTGHPLAAADQVSLAEVNAYPVIIPLPETIIRAELDRYMISNGFPEFDDVIETVSFDFARPYVENTDAIAILPRSAVRPELEADTMVMLAVPSSELKGPVGLTFLPGHPIRTRTQRLLGIIRKIVDERRVL